VTRVRKGAVVLVAAVNVILVVAAVSWAREQSATPATTTSTPPPTTAWEGLDAQGRCDDAVALVRRPDPWPTICRWREPGEALRGQSYPPPVGDPPWDRPRIEVFVGRTETRAEVAHTIAHELGHMTHTRVATFGLKWMQARGLPPDSPPGVWTEDYAEVFAALYGPPVDGWEAPTTRPSPAELAALELQFFAT
jgi:hypothetical protein